MEAIRGLFSHQPKHSVLSSLIDEEFRSKLESQLTAASVATGLSEFIESASSKKFLKVALSDLLKHPQLISNKNTTTILTFNHPAKRLLADVIVEPSANSSNILNAISETSLSCILVSLFLAIALVIAVNCMMNLKTNDKFARTQLHVGKES